MSRRNNKAATHQAETADLVSALSEAASSSSSSALIHATRRASSAALLAKEINHDSQPVATSRTYRAGIPFLFSDGVTAGSSCRQKCVFNRGRLTSK